MSRVLRRSLGAALLGVLPAASGAQGVLCQAEIQCRGDAIAMCAPSSLQIEVRRDGVYHRLWIDKQGPYAAQYEQKDGFRHWAIDTFGEGYDLSVADDGQFVYRGNRGKKFTGQCKEET